MCLEGKLQNKRYLWIFHKGTTWAMEKWKVFFVNGPQNISIFLWNNSDNRIERMCLEGKLQSKRYLWIFHKGTAWAMEKWKVFFVNGPQNIGFF